MGIFFPGVHRQTVKRWLRQLGREQTKAHPSDTAYFKSRGWPSCRYMISEDDFRAVLEYSKTKPSMISKQKAAVVIPPGTDNNTADIILGGGDSDCAVLDASHVRSPLKSNVIPPGTDTNIADIIPAQNAPSLDTPVRVSGEHSEILQLDEENNCTVVDVSDDIVVPLPKHSTPLKSNAVEVESDAGQVDDDVTKSAFASGVHSLSVSDTAEIHTCLPDENDPSFDSSVCVSGEHSVPSVQSNSAVESIAESDTRSMGKVGLLPDEAMSYAVKLSFQNLREFYTVTVHPLRNGRRFSPSTLNRFLERVSCFLNFCRLKKPDRLLDFDVVSDIELVQSYVDYQMKERKLCVSTVVRTLTVLINLARYVNRSTANVETCVDIVRLGNIQRQLSKEERSYQLAVKAGLDGKVHSDFAYSHILETLKKLREKVETTCGSPGHSRILHDFVLLSLYVTSMCGRSKELRTIQIYVESEMGRPFRFDWKKRYNVLVLATDGRFTIYENDFKTLTTHGPSKLVLEDSLWLIPFLKSYLAARGDLICGTASSHPYLFVTPKGEPFSCSYFSSYLAGIFEREVHIRAGTMKLRHALVTHVLSMPESESLRLRESLASLMRHSLKHQSLTYCDISRQERTSMSRELLNRSIEEAASFDTSIQRKPSADIGDLCALVDKTSTCVGDATIFVAKVVKFSGDEKDVLLMELESASDSEPVYRAKVDSCWWESVDSLVYPIDIAFDPERHLYELRSTVEEIYLAVFPEKL